MTDLTSFTMESEQAVGLREKMKRMVIGFDLYVRPGLADFRGFNWDELESIYVSELGRDNGIPSYWL